MDAARAAMRLTGMREEFMGTDGGFGAPREAEGPGAGLAAAIGAHAPAVVRRFAARWPCCSAAGLPQHEWSDANLAAWVGDEHVRVRVAERQPSECVAGRAEADDCGAHAFGDPAVADSRGDVYSWRTVRFRDFLTAAQADAESAAKGTTGGSASRLYAARVSLRALPELATRVPPAAELCPAVARCCGEPVDALATMYCGGATSTPCHFDPHEGFVIMLRGSKRVRLWSPGRLAALGAGTGGAFRYAATAHPSSPPPDCEVTVRAGDALYIPACWFHLVEGGAEGGDAPSGGCGKASRNVSVHWWYTMCATKCDPAVLEALADGGA